MRILLILIFCSPFLAYARKLVPIELTKDHKGALFSFDDSLKTGDRLYVYSKSSGNKLRFTSVMEIKSCDEKTCEAKILKYRKNSQLSLHDFYSTKSLHAPQSKLKDYGHLTIGGPLTMGFNLGYLRDWDLNVKWGGKVGMVKAEVGNVGISGNYLALQTDFKLTKIDEFEFNPYAELGYLRTTLDFKKINGPKENANVPYVGAGLNAWKFWEEFFLLAKAGYSYNFYKSTYSDDVADYSVPFQGGLIVFEIGAGMSF